MWRLHGTSLPVLGTKAGKGQSKKYVADDHEYVSEHCTAVAVPYFSPFSGFLILVGWEPLSRPGVTLSNLACPDLCHQPACWTVLLSPNPPFPWLCLQLPSVLSVSLCLSFKMQLFTMLWADCSTYPLPATINIEVTIPSAYNVTLLGSKVGQVKMKSLGWGLIQHDWHPYKGKFGCRHVQSKDSRRPSSKSRSAWGHQQLGERPGTSSFSWWSKRTNPAGILILDFQPAEMREKAFLLSVPSSLWYVLIAAPENGCVPSSWIVLSNRPFTTSSSLSFDYYT